MRTLGLLVVVALGALGCSASPKAEPLLTPGSRLIFHNGSGGLGVWSVCDTVTRSRLYLTTAGGLAVIPNACPTGEP